VPGGFDLDLERVLDEFDLVLVRLPDEFDEFDLDLGIDLDRLLVSELSDKYSHGRLSGDLPLGDLPLGGLPLLVRLVRLVSELSDEFDLCCLVPGPPLPDPPFRLNTIIYYIYIIIYNNH
jgi:hypothetical protein